MLNINNLHSYIISNSDQHSEGFLSMPDYTQGHDELFSEEIF